MVSTHLVYLPGMPGTLETFQKKISLGNPERNYSINLKYFLENGE
jgi:hypothetical protein